MSSSDSTRKMPALPARVGRLEHRREADLVGRAPPLGERAQRREARLRHAGLGERAPHRDLVRHQVRRLDADPRQPARLGDRGDDRHRAVGRDGQHAVELGACDRLEHRRRRRRSRRRSRSSRLCSPSASGFRSTASTRSPSSFARRIARRWWRPAPTKRTVFTPAMLVAQ